MNQAKFDVMPWSRETYTHPKDPEPESMVFHFDFKVQICY